MSSRMVRNPPRMDFPAILRPSAPAPITAMVRMSRTSAALQFFQNLYPVGVGVMHVLSQALSFFGRHESHTRLNATESGCDIIDVVHHANKFTASDGHESSWGYSRFKNWENCGTAPALQSIVL